MKLNLLSLLSPELRRQARLTARSGAALDPLSDIVFKSLFAADNPDSRKACRSLLSACTGRPVVKLSVKNNELLPEFLTGKTIRLDAHIAFNDGEKADLEMQMHKTSDDLKARALVCAAKLLAGQPLRGEEYRKVKRVYQIFFLNFELFPGSGKIPRRYTMREEREQDELTNLVTALFYELPKLERTVQECLAGKQELKALPGEHKWGIYFRYRNKPPTESLIQELCRAEEGIMSAERALQRMSLSERFWWWKYAREKRRNDYASAMDAARDEGMAKGIEEGVAEGMTQGIALTEAKYQPLLAERDQQISEKDRELAELRGKLESR